MAKKKFTWSRITYGDKPIDMDIHYGYYNDEELGYLEYWKPWKKWVWNQNEDIIMSESCLKEVIKKMEELA